MPVTIEVELDIFSGRPNPRWTLSDAAAREFTDRLAALPAAAPETLAGNLGYRGFVVDVVDGTTTGRVQVQGGGVHVGLPDSPPAFRRDSGRALEKWLFQTGMPFLDRALIEIVAAQLPADRP